MTLSPPGFDAPIFVTGMPRSGTTFMQHLLSSHERITIYGQEPRGTAWGDWLATLLDGIGFASDSNSDLAYSEPHYAGEAACPESTARAFLQVVFDYMTGGDYSPRWGLKSLTQCRVCPEIILELCPNASWIVCIRDPFKSIESLWNTFDSKRRLDIDSLLTWWTDAAKFAVEQSRAIAIQIDELSKCENSKQDETENLFSFLGEHLDTGSSMFLEKWPTVHQVVPPDKRAFSFDPDTKVKILESNHDFRHWAGVFGYDPSVRN